MPKNKDNIARPRGIRKHLKSYEVKQKTTLLHFVHDVN